MDPKPVKITSEAEETYSGPEPQPFVAVGGVPVSDSSVNAILTDPDSESRTSLNSTIDSGIEGSEYIADTVKTTKRAADVTVTSTDKAMSVSANLGATVSLSPGVSTVLDMDSVNTNSHGIINTTHTPASFTIPNIPGASGLWEVTAQVAFNGDPNGFREASLFRNSALIGRTQVAATGTRATVLQVTSGQVFFRSGDTIRLEAYVSGPTAALPLIPATTWISIRRVADKVGTGGDVLAASDWRHKGYSGYAINVNPENILFEDDPVLGAKRTVARFVVTQEDDQSHYPRVQLGTPLMFTEGAEDHLYVLYSIYFEPDFPFYGGVHTPVIGEVYGPPASGPGPNVIRIREDAIVLEPWRKYDPDNSWEPTGNHAAWTLPIGTERRGKWTYFIHEVKLSSDPAVGFSKIWLGDDNGRNWTQQGLKNRNGTAAANDTVFLATQGYHNSGTNGVQLKVAFTGEEIQRVDGILYGPHRVARTLYAAADGLWVEPNQ